MIILLINNLYLLLNGLVLDKLKASNAKITKKY